MLPMLRIVLFLLIVTTALCIYDDNNAVVSLDEKSFNDLVINSHTPAVVEFYAPWCTHCMQLAPQYKKVADNLKGIALVGAVDCDVDSNKKLCASNNIRGFPTLKIFSAEWEKNPYTGKYIKTPSDYQGSKTAKSIVAAVTATLTEAHITKLKSKADYDEFAAKHSSVAKALLFTNKAESSVLYKSLSTRYQGRMAFGEVHESAADLAEMHGVTQHPTFIVLAADGTSHKYDGELGAVQLGGFVEQHAAPAPADGGDAGDGKKGEAQEPPGLRVPPASEITLEQLLALDNQEEMTLAAVYSAAGDECAAAIADFQKLVHDMHGVVSCALVNAASADEAVFAKYGLDGAALAASPCDLQLVLLPLGKDKQELDEYQRYNGPLEAKAVQKFVLEAAPDLTVPLGMETFNRFLMAGQMGNTGMPMPKVVLVTNKDEVPGVYKALAINLASTGLNFGWVKSHIEDNKPLLEQLNIKKVPQMVVLGLMPPESPEAQAKGQMPMMIQPYNGPAKYNFMAFWLKSLAERLGGMMAGPDSKSLVPELASNADVTTHCSEKGGLCVIAMLAPTSPSFDDQLALLTKMAAATRGSPMSFMWVNGRVQRGFMAELGLKPADIPGVAVLSPKKLRYALLLEAFTEQNIKELLDGVLNGRVRTSPLSDLPTILEGSTGETQEEAPAAAADAAPPVEEEAPVEEEFDLSEIMAEDVESSLPSKEELIKELERKAQEEEDAAKKAEKKKKKSKAKKSKKSKGSDKDEL